jgi:hypothetical protein
MGEGVRHELYYADAVAVATETMRRARNNVEVLIQRLAAEGYRFIPPADDEEPDLKQRLEQMLQTTGQKFGPPSFDITSHMEEIRDRVKERMGPLAAKMEERKAAKAAKVAESLKKPPLQNPDVFDPPGEQTASLLNQIEKEAGGPMPISLRAWYEQVGGINLMGSHAVLNPKEGEIAADPLVVSPLREVMQMIESADDGGEIELWLAPDDLHKANVSGGSPYTIVIPNRCADAPFKYEWHDTTFVNYLRITFQWGGFPGWERDPVAPRAALAKLSEGLLPL